jgi:hypothetical protein
MSPDIRVALTREPVGGNGANDDLIPLNSAPVLWSLAMAPFLNSRRSACLFLLCAAGAGVSGCKPGAQSNNEQTTENVATAPAGNLAAEVPLPQPPIDRAALLEAVAEARGAAAAGFRDVEAQRALDGKQFELRIRFGCEGPAPNLTDAPLGWTYDTVRRVLRISATPTITGDDEVVAQLKPKDVEAVEGFWLPRPWLLQATCPAKPVTAGEDKQRGKSRALTDKAPKSPPEGQSPKIGIGQFFTAADPRTIRRDKRPYQTTKTLDADTRVGGDGFDLVLEGRLRSSAGRVILCRLTAADRAPDCIISARVDRVRFEQPETGETIADWGSS